jgi:hypothetical protein
MSAGCAGAILAGATTASDVPINTFTSPAFTHRRPEPEMSRTASIPMTGFLTKPDGASAQPWVGRRPRGRRSGRR